MEAGDIKRRERQLQTDVNVNVDGKTDPKDDTVHFLRQNPVAAQALTSPVLMCVRDLNRISFSKVKAMAAVWNLMPVRWLTVQLPHMHRDFRHSVRNRERQRPTPRATPFDGSLE